jgi:primosomal protein N' (replication factor Y)
VAVTERLIEIVLPLALRHPLLYRLPDHLADRAQPGAVARVPLGNKTVSGVILGEPSQPDRAKGLKLKDVAEISETALLIPSQIKLLRWAAAYYLTPIGEVLRHLSPPDAFEKRRESKPRKRSPEREAFHVPDPPPLNDEQKTACAAVEEVLEKPGLPILLRGITGSGKTEVYLKAARSALDRGGQVLVLVPEIGLTPQLLGRFRSLGEKEEIAAYHSA